jgi:hypothetical protein
MWRGKIEAPIHGNELSKGLKIRHLILVSQNLFTYGLREEILI